MKLILISLLVQVLWVTAGTMFLFHGSLGDSLALSATLVGLLIPTYVAFYLTMKKGML